MRANTRQNIRYILSTFLGAALLYASLCLIYVAINHIYYMISLHTMREAGEEKIPRAIALTI